MRRMNRPLMEFNNIEALRIKTDSLKIDIELEEKEIDNLKLKYDRLVII